MQFIRGKKLETIVNSQRIATENIFKYKKIPYRSFYIKKRNDINIKMSRFLCELLRNDSYELTFLFCLLDNMLYSRMLYFITNCS